MKQNDVRPTDERQETEKVNIRIHKDVLAWLRKAAAKKRITFSDEVRAHLLAAYSERHAK